MQIEQALVEVAERWQARGLESKLLPSASRSELDEFEAKFQVKLPDDFAMYLMTLGGMPLDETDVCFIRFWPLSEIEPDAEVSQPGGDAYFNFADFAVCAHLYAIRLTPPASSDVFLLGGPPEKVASSFTEFLTLYLTNPAAIHAMELL